jgi:hypothetical protein
VFCAAWGVQFRDVALDLAREDLPILRQVIAEERVTVLYVGEEGGRFEFSVQEIAELNRLLDRAQLIMNLNESELSASLQAASSFSFPLSVRSRPYARA